MNKFQTQYVRKVEVTTKVLGPQQPTRLVATKIYPHQSTDSSNPDTARFYAAEIAREWGIYSDENTEVVYSGDNSVKLKNDEWNFSGYIMHDNPQRVNNVPKESLRNA